MQRALVRERGRFLFTDATEAPGAAERAAPGTPPDETEREMHAMIIRQIEALIASGGLDTDEVADWRARREQALLRLGKLLLELGVR